ncbi:MAG TPA: elongation factor P [Chitinivibrionales bacterium]|nr:elongation factor P [Chitinivibrionales bacterium]
MSKIARHQSARPGIIFKEETVMATPNVIKKKNVLRYKGDIFLVIECVVRTPPNNRAFAQLELRSLTTGKMIPVRCSTGEDFEMLDNRFQNLIYSYDNQGTYVFLDPETYDQHELRKEQIEDVIDFLVPNQVYEVMFVENRPFLINLPASVEMKVTEAPEAVRGNSATNVTKAITLETGLVIQAPLFVKTGDVVKISTDEKKYLGRA